MQPATAQTSDSRTAGPEGPAGADSRPIDLVHLSKFTMGRRDLEAEILGLFRQQLSVSLDKLAAAADKAGDDKAWKEAAHTLKGSARGVGAWALADATADAELLTSGAERLAVIPSLDALVVAATSFIDELLEDWQS
ncbi:MAG: Hpt domain-containing protein [Candidatus Phaeomarinobacter sp.]